MYAMDTFAEKLYTVDAEHARPPRMNCALSAVLAGSSAT